MSSALSFQSPTCNVFAAPNPSARPMHKIVNEFERIARREKIQYVDETAASFEPKLVAWRKLIATP